MITGKAISISGTQYKANISASQGLVSNSDQFRFQVESFLLNNDRGMLYGVVKGIAWCFKSFGFQGRCKISRSLLAKIAHCHVDTVSSINMRIEEAGLVEIGREFKKINTYRTKNLWALLLIFGFVTQYPSQNLQSASLLDSNSLKINNNIYLRRVYEFEIYKFSSKKGEEVQNAAFIHPNCPGELRPSTIGSHILGNTIYISHKEQCSDINTNLLFQRNSDDEFIVDWNRLKREGRVKLTSAEKYALAELERARVESKRTNYDEITRRHRERLLRETAAR